MALSTARYFIHGFLPLAVLLILAGCGRKAEQVPRSPEPVEGEPAPAHPEPASGPSPVSPELVDEPPVTPEPASGPPLPEWIVEKPIVFDEERIELTKKYAKDHYGLDTAQIVPRMIVIHWTGGKSWKGAFKTFNKAKLSGRPFLMKYGELNVAAHYLVARDGTVYNLMQDTMMGRHVIGLNHCAIGVENVGNDDLTAEQLESNVKLVTHLVGKHDTVEYLIGHFEYLKFEGSALFIEKYPCYRTKKKDPGKPFMKELRDLLEEGGVQLLYEPGDLPVPLD